MKKVLLLAVAAAVSALAGCATTAGEGSDHPFVEKQYRTGSNIAARRSPEADGVTTVSKEDLDRARESSLDAGRGMPTPRPGGR